MADHPAGHGPKEDDAVARAAAWFAVLAGNPGDAERRAWRAWLDADPRHAAAWQRVEAMHARFAAMSDGADRKAATQALLAVRAAQQGRRRALKSLGVVGVGTAAWLTLSAGPPWQRWVADLSTPVGQRTDRTLADGTRLWLNTDSAVQVRYDYRERCVHLLRGEVLVETGHDPQSRPWALTLPEGRVLAFVQTIAPTAGTRFSAWRDGSACRLAVFDGAVELATAGSGVRQQVTAGALVRFDAAEVGALQPAAPSLAAWTRGMWVADERTVGDLCQELRRHRNGFLSCSPQAAALRVVGAFPLDAPEQIFDILQRTLPLRVARPLPGWVRIDVT